MGSGSVYLASLLEKFYFLYFMEYNVILSLKYKSFSGDLYAHGSLLFLGLIVIHFVKKRLCPEALYASKHNLFCA